MNPTTHSVLRIPESQIGRHWGTLQTRLSRILPKAGGEYRFRQSLINGISADLLCSNHNNEKALRERGGEIPVVPLLPPERSRAIRYWASLHQSWSEPATRREKSFLYHTTGITVFYGKENDRDKIQLFRAEWPGLRQLRDGSVEFEAPGAGHPHWQFDAYQHHLRERRKEQQRRDELEAYLKEEQPEAENFTDTVFVRSSPDEESELATHLQRLTRVHFASSTRWADNPWDGQVADLQAHAHAPTSLDQILNWITSTILYIRQEASR